VTVSPACLLKCSAVQFSGDDVDGAEYVDHIDCLADVQEDEHGRVIDCFGIYPQVLPLAYEWAIVDADAQGVCVCVCVCVSNAH